MCLCGVGCEASPAPSRALVWPALDLPRRPAFVGTSLWSPPVRLTSSSRLLRSCLAVSVGMAWAILRTSPDSQFLAPGPSWYGFFAGVLFRPLVIPGPWGACTLGC